MKARPNSFRAVYKPPRVRSGVSLPAVFGESIRNPLKAALKEQQKLEKELTGYVEWICRAGRTLWAEYITLEPEVHGSLSFFS